MWYMSTRLRVNVLVPKNVTALPMKEISCQFSEKLGLGVRNPNCNTVVSFQESLGMLLNEKIAPKIIIKPPTSLFQNLST